MTTSSQPAARALCSSWGMANDAVIFVILYDEDSFVRHISFHMMQKSGSLLARQGQAASGENYLRCRQAGGGHLSGFGTHLPARRPRAISSHGPLGGWLRHR